ncbi:MAG TPA: chloride channel protein, partial [Acidimicrobiales bacterium]|nr:chloride channel protein [Acidimicrobiales bacterium]
GASAAASRKCTNIGTIVTAMPAERPSDRVRVPKPALRYRIASGRGATEQPNATGDGDMPLTPRFWVLLVLTGVATGLFGDLMMLVLFSVQHATYGGQSGSFEDAVRHASSPRIVVALCVAGLFGAAAWYVLRRLTPGQRTEVDDAAWTGKPLAFWRSFLSGLISEVVIGMGGSIGRENGPRLMGGVSGSVLAGWGRLTAPQRRLLVACGAGAGLAAVYNVPLGGALYAAEILMGSIALPIALPALACSGIATATAWIYLPDHATYVGIPDYPFTATIMVWALLAGPVTGLVAAGWVRLVALVSASRLRGTASLAGMPLAFAALGGIAVAYPQLLGNGKDLAHDMFVGAGGGLGLLAVLVVLKPLVTALLLESGAAGGLFTPTMSTGAVLGALLGGLWSLAWPGSPEGAYAMVGAAAMIGAGAQAPLSGLVLVLELTHAGFGLMVPLISATALATLVTRYLDGYSIYSARLEAD